MSDDTSKSTADKPDTANPSAVGEQRPAVDDRSAKKEIGGRAGPEPTRFGDWEKDGRCIDF